MKKTTKIVAVSVLAAIILLGIGYAAIQNIELTITGAATAAAADSNFKVEFSKITGQSTKVNAKILGDDATKGTISVEPEALVKQGDTAFATFMVKNYSGELAAKATVDVADWETANLDTNTTETDILGDNVDLSEYFKVTALYNDATDLAYLSPADEVEDAGADEVPLTVKIELIKTPIGTISFTDLEVNLLAEPIQPEAIPDAE